ncbi:hypothetical protein BCR37DRAFT_400447 [Protomyces lactucae-debilis]|uniref:rhomboid protease n=1 Tax=Protomyces lactucae-debilis TaxID=2754530 RepID=A0A1Y2F1I3_PROLT|nr:uncharacterized protein BCR37DRAFT_400447 [Protomyces lactucae-debilis]ORY77728.1 hypothetical protein BCR37DRAFT_400447 [Protomyces lactucae-debilis]
MSMQPATNDVLEKARPYMDIALKRAKKLPLFTQAITAVMVLFFLLSFVSGINDAFMLYPSAIIPDWELSRLTTYPLVHLSFLHLLLNVIAFVPLAARFELRFGTLRTLAMLLGPFESVPGLLYCFFEGTILRSEPGLAGASGFVFTLLAIESMVSRQESWTIAGRSIPAWTAPIVALFVSLLLLPGSSFLGHLFAMATGYVFGSGHVDFLLLPSWVVDFVEHRGKFLFDKLPNYVTAERAAESSLGHGGLPTTEHPLSNSAGLASPGLGHRLGGRNEADSDDEEIGARLPGADKRPGSSRRVTGA